MKRKPIELLMVGVALVCVLVFAACNCTPTLRYITISPTTATIVAGTTQQYTATGYYSNGSSTSGLSVSWGSSNTTVATITSAGVASGLAAGTTTITATALGITATSATLNVNGLVSIAVTPVNQTITLGATEQFNATGTYMTPGGGTSTGMLGDLNAEVTWSANPASIATFSTTTPGLVTGAAPGTTVITATLGTVSGTTNLTVSGTTLVITPSASLVAVGNSVSFTVVEMQTGGTTNPTTYPVTWTSSTTTVANVVASGNATGGTLGAAYAVGTTTITATEAAPTPFTGTITLTVDAGTAKYAYVSDSGNNVSNPDGIGSYSVTAGASPYLTPITVLGTGGLSPSQTILNPNGQYLYAVETSSNTVISVYNINAATGALTNSGFTPVTVDPSSPQSIYGIVDPYGRFLFVNDLDDSSNPGGAIYAYTISQTNGSLTPVTGSPFTANVNGPLGMLVDHSGQYLYAMNSGGNDISAYQINQTTGALTALATPTYLTGVTPAYATWDPTGTYLYVADNGDGTITNYTLTTGGALSSQTTTTVTGSSALLNLAVTPNGSYLYVLDSGIAPANGALYGYTLTAGAPSTTPIATTPIATGLSPTGIAIDPTGALIAVDNAGDGTDASTISLFTIGAGGALTSQTAATAGVSPYFVTFYNVP
jgi:6-phosphogluconolactonase (cycloisomerase 2 family)